MNSRSLCLDDLLPVVLVAFALLCAATLWHDATQPPPPTSTGTI